MYREEGERGYKCVFGGREGVLTGCRGRGGHHRVGILDRGGFALLGIISVSRFHLAGGSFLATFPILSIKLSHNLGDHTYNNI